MMKQKLSDEQKLPPGVYTVQLGEKTATVTTSDGRIMNTDYPLGCQLLWYSMMQGAEHTQSQEASNG